MELRARFADDGGRFSQDLVRLDSRVRLSERVREEVFPDGGLPMKSLVGDQIYACSGRYVCIAGFEDRGYAGDATPRRPERRGAATPIMPICKPMGAGGAA